MESGTRLVRVRVQTTEAAIEGILEVPSGGYRGRLLDYLNGDSKFLALTNAAVWMNGQDTQDDPATQEVLLLHKRAIDFVVPLNEV